MKARSHRGVAILAALLLLGTAAVAQAQLPDFTGLVESASPAVVNISTKQNAPARGAAAQIPELEGLPPIFREFFEHGIPGVPGQGAPGQQREAQSLGSGFIISPDGYVLTNNHVVADADEIIVRLPDRSELEAELVGADPRTDVALIKVKGEGLPTVKLGDSSALKVGEWVLAIGSPFGFDHTVTAGIVSATGRNLPSESYVPFIQTDVAINPGNSGGPLFNLRGEVIGINSQIFTRSGGFMGLSFAIPIDVAMDVSDQLRTEGRVSRGWLGSLSRKSIATWPSRSGWIVLPVRWLRRSLMVGLRPRVGCVSATSSSVSTANPSTCLLICLISSARSSRAARFGSVSFAMETARRLILRSARCLRKAKRWSLEWIARRKAATGWG